MDLQEGDQKKGEGSASTTSQKTTANKLKKEEPYFYKIILAPSTQCQKLRIPQDYVKTHKRQFKKGYVKLRVPDNNIWAVELFKESGQVWLTKSWEVFFKNYEVEYGYFLLFSYDMEDFVFDVTIFGLTCCEIEYDIHPKTQQPAFKFASQDIDMDVDAHMDTVVAPEDAVVQEEPSEIKSQNTHFKVVMKHRNVSKDYNFNFPWKYIKEHLKPIKPVKVQEIVLTTVDGRCYNLKLTVYLKHCFSRLNNGGWRNFVEDNKLRRGDACVFEMVNSQSNMYNVTIFRANN